VAGSTPNRRVSLIATVRNEERSLPTLLASLAQQTRLPDEVVVVDGGSTDGTVALLRSWGRLQPFPVQVLEEPGANIARGRNLAIAACAHERIAVTDAGVELDRRWLEKLTERFDRPTPAQFVAGVFRGRAETIFQAAMSATTLPLPEELVEGRFLPSSRSVAFTKSAWRRVGGYPEWAAYCEDLLFDLAQVAGGNNPALARDAVVHFAPRGSLPAYWRQYRNYAMGDGQTGLLLRRHLIRYATYLVLMPALLWLAANRSRWWLVGFPLGAAVYLGPSWRRLPALTPAWPLRQRLRAALWVPLLRVWGDLAKMLGYPRGWRHGWRHRALNRLYKQGFLGTTHSDPTTEE